MPPRQSWFVAVCFAGLLASPAGASEIYKWTDSSGQVHYSDQPRPGAEKVELADTKSRRIPVPARRNERNTPENQTEPANFYSGFTIARPAVDETLWNIEGLLNVSLAVTPALRAGHRIRVYLDNSSVIVTEANFQLDQVWRGTHNLRAEILDEQGRVAMQTGPVQFHVRQTTVAN